MNVALPEISKDEILLKTIYPGISNGTERNMFLGRNYSPGFPSFLGYQLVGRVENVGG